MKPTHSLQSILSLVLALCWSPLLLVLGAPWIVTEYNQNVPVTYDYGYYVRVTTEIEAITPTVTALPEALSTVTQVNSLYELTAVQKLYPTGVSVGEALDLVQNSHYTVFVVDLVYTAPTGCSAQWTATETATVYPPDPTIEALLPRTRTSTSLSVNTDIAFRPTTFTYDVVWVDPTQVPSTSLASLRDSNYPATLYTGGANCYYTSSYNNYYSGSRYYDDYYDYYPISPLAILLIAVLGWVGLWFLLGILESWIRFRRLMLGWQTRRGLPVCWSLTILPLSLCCLFGFRKGFRARNAADSVILEQRWKRMSVWRKLKLFFIWGFRYKYPTVLGPPPPKVRVSKRPGKEVGPPLLQATPPGTRGASESVDPEMAQMGQGGQDRQVPLQPLPRDIVPEASGALNVGDSEVGRARSC